MDVRDPDRPALARIELPLAEEGTQVIGNGHTIYASHRKPVAGPDPDLNYIKHYVRVIDLTDPTQPRVGEPINVPGTVFAADGQTLFTREGQHSPWGGSQPVIARVRLESDVARLEAFQQFDGRAAYNSAGHIVVASRPGIELAPTRFGNAYTRNTWFENNLSILDAQNLRVLAEQAVNGWLKFRAAQDGRTVFQVLGGLLVLDTSEAAAPTLRFAELPGWLRAPRWDGDSVLVGSGLWGVYTLPK